MIGESIKIDIGFLQSYMFLSSIELLFITRIVKIYEGSEYQWGFNWNTLTLWRVDSHTTCIEIPSLKCVWIVHIIIKINTHEVDLISVTVMLGFLATEVCEIVLFLQNVKEFI